MSFMSAGGTTWFKARSQPARPRLLSPRGRAGKMSSSKYVVGEKNKSLELGIESVDVRRVAYAVRVDTTTCGSSKLAKRPWKHFSVFEALFKGENKFWKQKILNSTRTSAT